VWFDVMAMLTAPVIAATARNVAPLRAAIEAPSD